MRLIKFLILNTLAILAASALMPQSFRVDSVTTAIVAALVLGILNWTVKPILNILALPITILTLGLFTFVINGVVINLLASLMSGIEVAGFGSAMIVALIISIVNSVLNKLTKGNKKR